MSARRGFWARARAALARVIAPKPPGKRFGYTGALASRLTADWITAWRRSADQETQYDLRILRDRSRDLVRNTPFLGHFTETMAENVIGPHGIRLQAQNETKDGAKLHEGANTAIEDGWERWSHAEHCDALHSRDLPELLSHAVENWGPDGEILMRLIRGDPRTPFGFSVQLLDPDFLDETCHREAAPNARDPLQRNAIRMGVEIDTFGAPVAYYLWTRHPAEAGASRDRVRVVAADIIHVPYPRGRVGQHRGMPLMASILLTSKMLDGYWEAEIVASRIGASSAGVIQQTKPEDAVAEDPTGGQSDQTQEVEPGVWTRLHPGETLTAWNPTHPVQAFADFVRMLLHGIAVGIGISYGTLTGDLSQANYSSMRVGLLSERKHWQRLQQIFVRRVLDPIYREWLKYALLNQQIASITDFELTRWQNVRWQCPGFDWIDPLKDVQGDLLEVAAGVGTLTQMAAERGRDFEEIVAERKRELDILKAAGVDSVIALMITDKPSEPTQEGGPNTNQTPAAGAAAGGKSFHVLPLARSA
jgi:lambda family phage portal protein